MELHGIGTMLECDKYTHYTSMQPSRTLRAITGPRYGSKTCGNLDFGLISRDSPYDPKWARSDPKNLSPRFFFGFSCRVDILVGCEHHLVQYNWSTKFVGFFPAKSRGVPGSERGCPSGTCERCSSMLVWPGWCWMHELTECVHTVSNTLWKIQIISLWHCILALCIRNSKWNIYVIKNTVEIPAKY